LIAKNNDLHEYLVEGTSFSPEGEVRSVDGKAIENPSASDPTIATLARIAALCNDSKISYDPSTNTYARVGEATEAALVVLAEKLKTGNVAFDSKLSSLDPASRFSAVNDRLNSLNSRLLTFEFSRDRKSMSVLVREEGGGRTSLFVKGAPESVLERCTTVQTSTGAIAPLTDSLRRQLQDALLENGRQGLRSLALAVHTDVDPDASHYKTTSASEYVRFEQDLTLVGLVGMLDPPRPEVRGAIEKCRTAGIRIIVITGDNKNTAETICRQIGIFGSEEDLTGKSYTGKEFDALSPEKQKVAVAEASLFSRTEPNHKRQLVDLLQESGLVVAMVCFFFLLGSSLYGMADDISSAFF
jgi:Ca2+ transporting ATPase